MDEILIYDGKQTMTKTCKSPPAPGWLLIVLHFLLGVGALGGGAVLVAAPDGSIIRMPLSMLEHSPFSNFLIPGIILFLLLGVYPILAAYSLWACPAWRWPDAINPFKKIHWAWAGSLAAGVIALIWIVVEMVMLRSAAFLQILYLVWPLVLILLTLLPTVRRHYERQVLENGQEVAA